MRFALAPAPQAHRVGLDPPCASLRPRSCFVASWLCRWKRRARAFGQPCGLPDLLLFAWPLRRRSGANAEGGPEGAEGRTPGVKKGRPKKGHPSSAPFAHPCAQGSRVSAGVRGQCIPALSRTSPASMPAPLRADRPSPAAPQGPRGRARAPARKSRIISGGKHARPPPQAPTSYFVELGENPTLSRTSSTKGSMCRTASQL